MSAFWLLASTLIGLFHSGRSLAQGELPYPVKPVRFVVGQAPGGATDIVARDAARKLTGNLRQNLAVSRSFSALPPP